ncbi:enhancer of mRNA-decapping protein 4 isoform X1 [Acyrthosiphon pisum]|uniref:Enhancer of mRNA-decapping protein 4 WD40 repeat region domain-containing protein n=1 Tax=Acyrthosiphon pisum TaxID=7029 RepID=A0A8R2JX82_ACYPI|nr:enhancer of mRNA-decapping protein 4 isoform X1 [Acyrthosiphon pisum]
MTEEIEEIVRFIGDEECTHTIHSNSTKVFSSQGSHNKGSSQLTLKNFVNFNWDQCYYLGQLIALHISEKYIAYGFSNTDTYEGLVRIVKTESNERALIKGLSNLIEDISFAHLYEIIMLGCIDQSGTTYVYVIKEESCSSPKLKAIRVFQINGDPSYCFKNKYLLSWCQYIPEQVKYLKELEFEPTYKGKMLAVVRASEVEIWHVGVASSFTTGPVFSNINLNKSLDKNVLINISNVVIKINLKEADIISLSFSPDGSTISLALSNGSIYFYQVSFDQISDTPKCVFTWHPKEIFLSLKSLAFLDNRKIINGDVELWKYVVTLSNNDEIILWSCETWTSLQIVKFIRPFSKQNPMKLTVDGTGRYIFLSDIDNNLLYVMEVADEIQSAKKNIKIVGITEVLLQSPMLNMIIVDAKVDHNDLDITENHNSNNISTSSCNYTTVINLFAIQPKSLQEGQLIIASPELSIAEQYKDQNKIEPTNIFPKPPILDLLIESVNPITNTSEAKEFQIHEEENNILHDLNPLEVHSIVKEKLRLKGISLNQKSIPSSSMQIQNRQKNSYNNIQPIVVQSSNTYTYTQDPFDLNEVRECSPSNNEVQTILQQHNDQELQYNYMETHNDNFETVSNYSNGIDEKEESNCYSSNSVFNGSEISTIRRPLDKSDLIDNGIGSQIDDILTSLQEMNTQLKCISKKQKKIDNQINAVMSINSSSLCANLEPALMNMVKNASDQSHRKLQMMIDHQLNTSHKKITEIVKATNSNKVDTELFTKSLVASLNPTLDAILKDLFMSTVIPKFEHACCSMFKQIDASFTERSLEYQNELKSLLNEEGNINNKLEYAFDKFKGDMNNIIKSTEKKILSTQNDLQKQFSILLKEKSHVEPSMKDTDNTATQFMILCDIMKQGDYALAFEKALSASKLELVLFVCEKIQPELLFTPPNALKTPIVLSLIQQLSHDLTNNTELKHKYLEAAIGSLDYTNDHHKENTNLVLIKMDSSVEKFVQQYPLNPYSRRLKMLQLAIKTIISYQTANI